MNNWTITHELGFGPNEVLATRDRRWKIHDFLEILMMDWDETMRIKNKPWPPANWEQATEYDAPPTSLNGAVDRAQRAVEHGKTFFCWMDHKTHARFFASK